MVAGNQRAPRIVIYGTGRFGQLVARLAVAKGMTIVGAYNRAGAKVGRRLSELAALPHDPGLTVEDAETADFYQVDADIAIVATTDYLRANLPAYMRLLQAKWNVLCHGAQSMFPAGIDPLLARQIDETARTNGVTFTGGGIWDASRIWSGILVAGHARRSTPYTTAA